LELTRSTEKVGKKAHEKSFWPEGGKSWSSKKNIDKFKRREKPKNRRGGSSKQFSEPVEDPLGTI